MPERLLVWLDVETTGLDPQLNVLLEIAAVVTKFSPELPIVGEPFEVVLRQPHSGVGPLSAYVAEMHAKNGLWQAVEESTVSKQEALNRLMGFMGRVPSDSYLAGRSVHFDRRWLAEFFEKRVSHRHFDLTSIKLFMALKGIEFEEAPDVHRALPDVLADIELARRLLA